MIDPTQNPEALQAATQAATEEAQRQQATPVADAIGGTLDVLELGGLVVDAAGLAMQAGGVVVDAGVATVKVVAAGAEAVGSIFSIFDGL